MSIPHRRVLPNDYSGRSYLPQRPATGVMAPPPLPPRRIRSIPGPSASMYGSPFGSGYGSPYGGDMFGSSYMYPYRSTFPSRYGGYGYGGYGAEDPYSPFQSVESLVRAISSLSMMVESTYQSMYMSFRAVLGVADNMDQLRRVVFDLFGSLTLVRTFVWFCKKILYILGLLKNNPVREKAWEAAAAEVGAPAAVSSGRTWPLVAFFGLMLGGPYVLYKLASPPANATWDPKTEGGIKCVAIHDFETDQRGELPFRRGEVIVRQNQAQGGWALATKKSGQIGYVPVDRLKPVNQIAPGAQQKPLPPKPNPVTGYSPLGSYGPPHLAAYSGPAVPPASGADLEYMYDDVLTSHPPPVPEGPLEHSAAGIPTRAQPTPPQPAVDSPSGPVNPIDANSSANQG